jgi:hypothetical protein
VPQRDRGEALAEWLAGAPVERWNLQARAVVLVVFVAWTLWIWRDLGLAAGSSGSRFLHLVQLPFHEAGHYAIFRWFGRFIMLGYSTLDMAVYMYDAFDPQLTLIGGLTGAESDGHDWQNLFGDMGLLRHARGIGRFFCALGAATMALALAWAGWVLRRQQRHGAIT